MLHEKYENMISEYLDGELSEAEEKELILHLEGCPDCAEHLAFVKKLSENLSIAPEEPSPDFMERLMNRLAFEPFEEEKKENKLIKLFNKKSFALAASLALVIITALFALPRLSYNMKSAAPQMRAEEAADESKNEKTSAFDVAVPKDSPEDAAIDEGSEAAESGVSPEESLKYSSLEPSLISALGDILAENPAFRLYDSFGNMVFENTAGAELIDVLLSELYEDEKKETFEPDYELIFVAEDFELKLKIYTEDKAFYVYAEDFDKALRVDRNFSEFMSELFRLNLDS